MFLNLESASSERSSEAKESMIHGSKLYRKGYIRFTTSNHDETVSDGETNQMQILFCNYSAGKIVVLEITK